MPAEQCSIPVEPPCPIVPQVCVCGATLEWCSCAGHGPTLVHLACGACTQTNGVPLYDPANDPMRQFSSWDSLVAWMRLTNLLLWLRWDTEEVAHDDAH